MSGNFDRVAWWYDGLARLVFGRVQQRAAAHFLAQMPAQGRVLLVGGGSGELLLRLQRQRPELEVWYAEASRAMLRRARRRWQVATPAAKAVHWWEGDAAELPPDLRFAAIITPFVLDLYAPTALQALMQRLDRLLLLGGCWLQTDFQLPVGWGRYPARLLLALMYRLFRLTADIEARQLPPMAAAFEALGYERSQQQAFWGGFILSEVRLKKSPLGATLS